MVSIQLIKTNTDSIILRFNNNEFECEISETAFQQFAEKMQDFCKPEKIIASYIFDPISKGE